MKVFTSTLPNDGNQSSNENNNEAHDRSDINDNKNEEDWYAVNIPFIDLERLRNIFWKWTEYHLHCHLPE